MAHEVQARRWVGRAAALGQRSGLEPDIIGQPYLMPLDARSDKLHDVAAAHDGWRKAGKPEPQPGQSRALIKLLPHCTLVPIPWGCKGPQEVGWQNTSFAMMALADYWDKLNGGNVGLLCGRDWEAVTKKVVPNQVVVGLDGDDEGFADSVYGHNPWLTDTFAVQGKRAEKWFFAVIGPGADAFLHSSKIMQRRAQGDVEVGDLLSTGKQGVICGLHPAGIYLPCLLLFLKLVPATVVMGLIARRAKTKCEGKP